MSRIVETLITDDEPVDYYSDNSVYVSWRYVDSAMAIIAIALWIVIIALAMSGS